MEFPSDLSAAGRGVSLVSAILSPKLLWNSIGIMHPIIIDAIDAACKHRCHVFENFEVETMAASSVLSSHSLDTRQSLRPIGFVTGAISTLRGTRIYKITTPTATDTMFAQPVKTTLPRPMTFDTFVPSLYLLIELLKWHLALVDPPP